MAERVRGPQGPVRVAQQLACEQHGVGLPGRDDLVGLVRVGDEADGAGRHTGVATNPAGERHLVPRRDRNLLV